MGVPTRARARMIALRILIERWVVVARRQAASSGFKYRTALTKLSMVDCCGVRVRRLSVQMLLMSCTEVTRTAGRDFKLNDGTRRSVRKS